MGEKEALIADLVKRYKQGLILSGVDSIWRYYEKKLSRRSIEDVLKRFRSFTLHRDYKKPRGYNPTYVRALRQSMHTDLFNFDNQAAHNFGFAHVLLLVDSLSKYVFIRPLKSKKGEEVTKAFKSIIDNESGSMERLVCDAGREFMNHIFLDFCHDRNIQVIVPPTSRKAYLAERAIKDIKKLASRYMTLNRTQTFIKVLPSLQKTYNLRYNRGLQSTPDTIETNEKARWHLKDRLQQRYDRIQKKKKTATYDIRDTVRIHKDSGKLARGYKANFSEEVFLIHDIHRLLPRPLYILSDITGQEVIRGRFREEELRRATFPRETLNILSRQGSLWKVSLKERPNRRLFLHEKNIQ